MSTRAKWWDRLNGRLLPYIGPPPLGPGPRGERTLTPTVPTCPLCGHAMSTHVIERTADWSTPTRLQCP